GLSAGVAASAACSASPGGGASLRLVSFDKFSFALIIFKVAAKYTNPRSRATAFKNPGGETPTQLAREFVVCPSVSFWPMFASGALTNVLNLSNDLAVYSRVADLRLA